VFGVRGGPQPKKQPVVLTDLEASKPVGVRTDTGQFVTLEQFKAEPKLGAKLASLASLDYTKQAEFTIARLQKEPPDLKVSVIGVGELSRDEIIDEIRKGSDAGKEFVEIEQAWVERVKEKVSKGEYQLSVSANVP